MSSPRMRGGAAETSRWGAFVAGVLDGGTLGSFDEMAGALAKGDDSAKTDRREFIRGNMEGQRRDHPWMYLLGQGVGAASTLAPAFKAGKTLAGTLFRAGASGGTVGAIESFNSGEGGLVNRALRVPLGAAGGAAGGVVSVPFSGVISFIGSKYGPKVARIFRDNRYVNEAGLTEAGRSALTAIGFSADEISESIAREVQRNIKDGMKPVQAGNVAVLEEFGIPAYRANQTGDVNDFALQEAARRGGLGASNARRAQDALDTQEGAMRRAGDDIATGLTPGGVRADQGDAAVAVSEGLRRRAAEEQAAAGSLYRASEAAGVSVTPNVAAGISTRIKDRLAQEEIYLDLDAYPQARAYVERLSRRGDRDDGVSLRLIDGMRKDINRAVTRAGSGTEDARALQIIKDEYDEWFDDVVTARLFDGDIDGVDNLKAARAAFAEYAKKFRGKDAGSRFVQQMMDADASPDDVVRWLFSSGKLGTGKFNSTLAKSLRETLGSDSTEWNTVRQAAFRQIIERPEGVTQWGPQKLSTNIGEFLTSPSSRELSQVLFTPQERAQMMRFRSALNKLVPPPGAVNYSNTAYENTRMVQRVFQGLAAMVGMNTGGPAGAVAGAGAAQTATTARGWLATSRAFRQPARRRPSAPALGVGAVGGSTTAQDQALQE